MPPTVDLEKCTGCGTCVQTCPAEVLAVNDGKAKVVKPDECLECRACDASCPTNAISFP
jgi:NAD-dependent dihydropyrimidine dehydrogenase PreA subunit